MLKHERLRHLALRIEQGRTPLRWLDLYAAQSLLESIDVHQNGSGLNAKDDDNGAGRADAKATAAVDAQTVDLLVLCSACSLVGQVSVNLSDLVVYQSLGLFFGLKPSKVIRTESGAAPIDDQRAETAGHSLAEDSFVGGSLVEDSLVRLASLGLLQSRPFLEPEQTEPDTDVLDIDGAESTEAFSPLLLTEGRLYLRRVWLQRCALEYWLNRRRKSSETMIASAEQYWSQATADAQQNDALMTLLHENFRHLFKVDVNENSTQECNPSTDQPETDWQAVAALQALTQSFCLVSGGPGTGKTSTAARILLLLLIRHVSENGSTAMVRLLAPTGKAAVRLYTSIAKQFQHLCCSLLIDESARKLIAESFPEQGETIHRALLKVSGALGNDRLTDRVNFHHSDSLLLGPAEQSALRADIILIDEASMIDQKLMADLVGAIPDSSRVVILGDHFQLPPVEPGEVFADWIVRLETTDYSQAQFKTMAGYSCALESVKEGGVVAPSPEATVSNPTNESARLICQLQRTYRFSGPIFEMAQALRGNQDWSLESLLPLARSFGRASGPEDLFECAPLTWVDLDIGSNTAHGSTNIDAHLAKHFEASLAGYESYFELVAKGASTSQLAAEKDRFQILCSTYEGPLGAANINRLIEQRFAHSQTLYEGKVVMVTQNQPDLDLYNGDVGYLKAVSGSAQQQFVVTFPDKADGELTVPLLLIRQWQSAYAMSIHKSQGCEYERVMVIVPDYARELVSRRLVYTAITRSQKEVELWMSRASLSQLGAR